MRIFELSPRLRSVADLVPKGTAYTDVGTDHAYLPVWLILKGVLDCAVVSDLREGPLDRARQTAARYGIGEQISFRLCDGLSAIRSEEAESISIAGMGGETIAAILAAAPWTREGNRRLILQPMTAQEELRRFLCENGYTIECETLTQESRTLYNTLLVHPGFMEPLSPGEVWAGRQRRGQEAPYRGIYLEKLLHRAQLAAEGAKKSLRMEDGLRAAALMAVAEDLQRMKEEWNSWQQ